MQAHQEPTPDLTEEARKYQIERVEKILAEIEAGQMKLWGREEAWEQIREPKAASAATG